jgi:hypothetical protein
MRTLDGEQNIAASWFAYNPLFNAFKWIPGVPQPVVIDELRSPPIIAKVEQQFAEISQNGVLEFPNDHGRLAVTPQGFVSEIVIRANGLDFVSWSASGYFPILESEVSLPKRIKCDITDSHGRKFPISYSIVVDEDSVRSANLTENDFRIPLSAADTVYDASNGIILKDVDFQN